MRQRRPKEKVEEQMIKTALDIRQKTSLMFKLEESTGDFHLQGYMVTCSSCDIDCRHRCACNFLESYALFKNYRCLEEFYLLFQCSQLLVMQERCVQGC